MSITASRRGRFGFLNGNYVILTLSAGILESVTFAAGLHDLTAVRQAIEHHTGQSLAAQHFGPLAEWQSCGHNHALAFAGPPRSQCRESAERIISIHAFASIALAVSLSQDGLLAVSNGRKPTETIKRCRRTFQLTTKRNDPLD